MSNTGTGRRRSWWYKATSSGWERRSWTLEWIASCCAPWHGVEIRALEDRAERDLDQRWVQVLRSRWTYDKSWCMQKLMAQRSGFDLIQEIHQMLNGTNTTQRICRSAVGVSIVLLERCQTCHTRDAVRIVTCPKRRWTTSSWTASRTASRWPFACPVDKGPGDFPVSVICKGFELCGRRRFGLKTDNEHAISALSTVVRSGQWNCKKKQEEESNKARDQFYCSLDLMNSGGQSPRNVMAIHAMSKISHQVGKLHMNGDCKNTSVGEFF